MPLPLQKELNLNKQKIPWLWKRRIPMRKGKTSLTSNFIMCIQKQIVFKVARGYFLGTEVLFSKSSFGQVNLNRFFWFLAIEITNVQIL